MGDNLAYSLGVIAGVLFVALICGVVALVASRRGKSAGAQFDERQIVARGKAYRYAFFTVLIYLLAWGLFELAAGIRLWDTYTGCFLGVFLSVTVFAVVAILNDAYFAVNEKPATYLGLSALIAILNLGTGVWNLYDGDEPIIENGVLTYHSVNLLVGGMFLIILIVAAIRIWQGKREDA